MSLYWIVGALIIDGLVISANIIELTLLLKKWSRLDRIDHLLFSLCVSDLIAGVCAFTQDSMQLREVLENCQPKMMAIESKVFDCLFFFVLFSSNFHVAAIAVERLVAVLIPLRYSVFTTSKCKTFTLCLVWISALTLAPIMTVLQSVLLGVHARLFSASFLIASCSVIFLAYVILTVALIIRERRMVDLISQEMKKQTRDRRTTCFCLLLGISFVICVLPFSLGLLKNSLYHDSWNLLITANHIINPFVYFAKSYFDGVRRKRCESTVTRMLSRTLSSTKC